MKNKIMSNACRRKIKLSHDLSISINLYVLIMTYETDIQLHSNVRIKFYFDNDFFKTGAYIALLKKERAGCQHEN